MYVYMYLCMYVCMYVYMCICVCVYELNMYICMYVYMYLCMYVCMYTCVFVYVCMCVCIYPCMYVCVLIMHTLSCLLNIVRLKPSPCFKVTGYSLLISFNCACPRMTPYEVLPLTITGYVMGRGQQFRLTNHEVITQH